jgi:hypothetical protein
VVEAQIDGISLSAMIGPYAYVGFTAGQSAGVGKINIRDWAMKVVPASALMSAYTVEPSNAIAGEASRSTIQVSHVVPPAMFTPCNSLTIPAYSLVYVLV